jgi:DNA topoisomerase-1
MTGLITYMRTDSLRLSEESKTAAREFIAANYGEAYMPSQPRNYKSKNNAQDAHEAIRPSIPSLTPTQIKESLTSDQFKLYQLIWERFIACQMSNAVYDTVSVSLDANQMTFRASGYSVKFAGFTALYEEKTDEKEEQNSNLPPLTEGTSLKAASVTDSQHFTQPPARYTEASLIKTLEENGIGRPSTYAPTITTIVARNYVEREGKQLVPTNLGEITTKLMEEYFSEIVDIGFTAHLEQGLDTVADGEHTWNEVIGNFYSGFSKTLEYAQEHIGGEKIAVPDEVTDVICELCGRNMVIKYGRYGKFLACPGYPECKNAKRLAKEAEGRCPLCGDKLQECKSKKGRKYFGCVKNPTCNFMTWDTPTRDNCPKCGKTLLRKAGRNGKLYCSDVNCDYERKE